MKKNKTGFLQETNSFYEKRWKEREEGNDLTQSKERRLRILKEVINKFKINKEPLKEINILDYGCGSGWLIPKLKELGFTNIHVYDVTASPLNKIKNEYQDVSVWVGNGIFPSKLPDNTFDMITSVEVVEHIPDSEKKLYFSDIYRIAKKNALIIITTPNGKWRNLALPKNDEQPVEDWVNIHKLKRFIKNSGFSILELGSKGIFRYSKFDNIILSYRIKKLLKQIGLWEKYESMLEQLNRGITLYTAFIKK